MRLHDPLTAATIFDAKLCEFKRGRVTVDGEHGTTYLPDVAGPHEVAVDVDERRFF